VKPTLIIAPRKEILYEAKKLVENYDDVDVELALLEQALEIARNAEREGVEAIISRGGTARIIEKAVPSIPIVHLKIINNSFHINC
jgi:predicted RNA-binding protein YlqC (UPF0109 family)